MEATMIWLKAESRKLTALPTTFVTKNAIRDKIKLGQNSKPNLPHTNPRWTARLAARPCPGFPIFLQKLSQSATH
jgi:hypothetical protein